MNAVKLAKAFALINGHKKSDVAIAFIGTKGTTLTELRKRLRVAPASLSRILTSLERDGLIVRSIDPSDRRCICVALTEHGAMVLRNLK